MNATLLESIATHPLVTSIGWSLIHFVWQAALVGTVVGLTLGIMRDRPARWRYLFGLAGLAIMTTIPIGTFIYLISASAADDWKFVTRMDSMNPQNGKNNSATPPPRGDVDVVRNLQLFPRDGSKGVGEFPGAMANVVDSKSMRASVGWISKLQSLARTMQQWLPWCVVVWFVGVSCLACRLLAGLRRVWLWRSKGKEIVGGDLAGTVARLSRQMKLRQPIRLLATVRETVPAVIGWMRPAILIPTSMLTGLTARELEAILAHELAHIRRHDYLVNLMQTVVETLLFYHPAVWWLSNRIRIERENCCDDIAVEVCGNRVAFARALTRLEELRCKHNRLSVAANGGSLVHRIRRIVLAKPQSTDTWWPAGAIVLASLALVTSGLLMSVASGDATVPGVADKAGSAIIKNGTSGAAVLADAFRPENDEYPWHKPEVERVDAKTGQSHPVMADVKLSVGEKPPALVNLKYSNLFNYTLIPERIALELQAVELGVIDFGEKPQPKNAGQRLQINWQLLVPPPAGTDTKPIEKPAAVESVAEVVTVDQLVEPAGERRIVPYAEDAIWIPDHLAFYGVNANRQTKFRVVRIDQVDLGIGPSFGPVNALVIDDANTDLGVLGSNWARIPRGRNGEGFVWAAVGGFYFMAMEPPDSPRTGAAAPAMESDRTLEDQKPAPSKPVTGPQLTIVQRDGDRIELATLENPIRKFSALELVRRHRDASGRFGPPDMAGWLTAEETLVSSERPNYVLGGVQTHGMDAHEVIFNLPEGSDMRAEFSGKNVQTQSMDEMTIVKITEGRLRLIDAGGVVRADASADGGAELLIVECREAGDEYTMKLRTRWSDANHDSETPPVQVKLNLATGAPADEEQPPHGAIRFRIDHDPSKTGSPMKMKIRWHHDLTRLAEEAVQETGKSWDKILIDDSDESKTSIPIQTFDNAAADDDWGPENESSGLRLRLTVAERAGKAGDPVLCKLELRNFGTEDESYDPQVFAPFRVVKANNAAGQSDWFIGPIAQTFGGKTPLRPNDTVVLWEDVDVGDLYLLDEGQYELSVVHKGFINEPSLSSNTVSIRVAAGQFPPRKQFLKQLRDVVPAGWEVSSNFYGIHITNSPTGLKQDVTSVQIWFTEEKLPDDFELGKGDARQIISQLGRCELGYMNLAGPQRAATLWPDYLASIRNAATRALNFAPDSATQSDESNLDQTGDIERNDQEPWRTTGQVTNAAGTPIAGVTVRAHTGIGSLRQSGETTTGADGKYDLRFGPGFWSENRQMVQAATISVQLDGHFERNLHRQGDRIAALEKPDGEIGWGGKTLDDLFLPGESKEINFVMLPAAKVSGMVIDQNGDHLDGVQVSLVGAEMPPSSSVVANTRTDKGGRFEMTGVPTGFKFQFLIEPYEAKPPWLAWASAPMVFAQHDDGNTHFEYSIDGNPVDFSCQQLTLILNGNGVSWKMALKVAAERNLELTWDGLSTDKLVRAGMAFLELGDEPE